MKIKTSFLIILFTSFVLLSCSDEQEAYSSKLKSTESIETINNDILDDQHKKTITNKVEIDQLVSFLGGLLDKEHTKILPAEPYNTQLRFLDEAKREILTLIVASNWTGYFDVNTGRIICLSQDVEEVNYIKKVANIVLNHSVLPAPQGIRQNENEKAVVMSTSDSSETFIAKDGRTYTLKVTNKDDNRPPSYYRTKSRKYSDGKVSIETFENFVDREYKNSKNKDKVEESAEKLLQNLESGNFSAVEYVLDSMSDDKVKNDDGLPLIYPVYKTLAEIAKQDQEKLFNSWCEVSANTTSYSSRIARAFFYVIKGWDIRGTRYSKDVKEENYKLFKEYLKKAEEDINYIKQNYGPDPMVASISILVTKALHGGSGNYDFDLKTARKVDPSFYWLYLHYFDTTLPKWGGSWETAYTFTADLFDDTPDGSLAYELMLDLIYQSKFMSSDRGRDFFIDKPYKKYILETERRFVEEDPDSLFILSGIAKIRGMEHFRNSESFLAKDSFFKMIEIDPQDTFAWNMLGQTFSKHMGMDELAYRCFTAAIEIDDADWHYEQRGRAAWSLNDNEQCINDINHVENSSGLSFIGYSSFVRAECYDNINNFEASIKDFTTALNFAKSDGNFKHFLKRRAQMYSKTEQHKKALEDISKLIDLDPQHKWAKENIDNYKQNTNQELI